MKENEIITEINFGLRLIEKKDGLRFGTDAVLLAAYLRSKKFGRYAELGSGSGVVSLLAGKKEKFLTCDCYEIDSELCEMSEENIKENGFSDLIKVYNTDCREIKCEEKYDSVFFNPPYFTKGSGRANNNSIKNSSRHSENGDIDDFCSAAGRMLKFGGEVTVVYRPERLSELITSLNKIKCEPKRLTLIYPVTGSVPSLVLLSAKKGASPGLFITKNLCMKNTAGDESKDLKYIYENGDFHVDFKAP